MFLETALSLQWCLGNYMPFVGPTVGLQVFLVMEVSV